jgi:nucleoside-diphosphate-sugar epimerase
MQKVIITGAGGYLGSRLTKAFVDQGITVYALDCTSNSPVQHKLARYAQCDIEKNILPSDSDMRDSDILFHFAWDGAGSEHRNNYEHQQKNISSLLNILSFARRFNVSKTIIPGSASEYASSEMPITGNNMPGAVDAYGAVKSACHTLSRTWSMQNNLPLVWVVPSSVYGPGRNDNNVLTYAIKTLLKKEKPSFTALEQRWDYIYIEDFIAAFVLIAQKGVAGKNYALGYGRSRTLREYITLIRDSINPALPIGIGEIPYKAKKPDNSEMDIAKLQNDTGFSPATVFEEGIKRTIEWFEKTM